LNPNDQETIISLVRQYIGLNLTKNNGFDALRSLIYANIPNSLETYCRILQDCDSTLVPAKEGLEIMMLIKRKQECVTIINPLIDHLKTTNSMIGKALTKQTERKVK